MVKYTIVQSNLYGVTFMKMSAVADISSAVRTGVVNRTCGIEVFVILLAMLL